tara:strand:- start:14 stop:943 length:930 start_codon:yes stop_codon:yes gene_type:complete
MGYKLAGFNVIGCNEIDEKMIETYKANHNPKFAFLEGIQTFAERDDYPEELYNLDILDGSPPCSSFSTSGNRDKDWGKNKKFKEGQAEQVLDTLFFDFIKLAKKLQPKVVVAENVKGLLLGTAQKYVNKILLDLADAGYYVDYVLLDGSDLGVPQRRERVFFYAIRKDLYKGEFADLFQTRPVLNIDIKEPKIPFSQVQRSDVQRDGIAARDTAEWEKAARTGQAKKYGFLYRALGRRVCATILTGARYCIEDEPLQFVDDEFSLVASFPLDYNFLTNKAQYITGMSVPPVMMAHIADAIYEQWLKGTK